MNSATEIAAIAALDPGRDKCGLAVLSETGGILLQKVIQTASLEQEIMRMTEAFQPKILVLGNGTTSQQAEGRIRHAVPSLQIEVVDEYRTTEEARREYWKEHPPTGWRRILPTTMQVPPVPVDDFVAVLLGKRFLGTSISHGASRMDSGE